MKPPHTTTPNPGYADAWARTIRYGVDPHQMPDIKPVSAMELQARIKNSRALLEAALPFVDHLYSTVESECIVAICDQDGVLLSTRGERLPDELLHQHTTPGIVWTEEVFGANAMGTALAEDRPIQMVGEEHYLHGLHGMSCAATPLHDEKGQIVGGLAIAAYKTEHSPYMLGTVLSIGHAIEKAMILRSEHYQSLLLQEKVIESSNNLMLVADTSGRIIQINKAARQVLAAGKQGHLQDLFPANSAALIALTEHRNLTDFHEKRICKNRGSKETHINWDAHWIVDSLHEQSTLLLVGRDVTKHVRMERTMQQSERLSTMGKFSAQIAHEIRNPVAVIKLAMQLMLKQEEFTEKSQKKGEMILSELRRIEDLVNHFLQISKPQMPNFSVCRITELVLDTCQLMQGSFVDANLRLIERCEEVGTIIADCDQLQQVFLNLMRNAIDATPAGGTVDVQVRRDPEEPDHVVIRISDTGQGIPEDRLQDVFEAFYTTKSKGTGLGLSNAKAIIEAHGGDMEVESAVDHGTVITIWLPEQPPAADNLMNNTTNLSAEA